MKDVLVGPTGKHFHYSVSVSLTNNSKICEAMSIKFKEDDFIMCTVGKCLKSRIEVMDAY